MDTHASNFVRMNASSPVISGYVLEPDPRKPRRGCVYELECGEIFKLTAEQCRSLPNGFPKWKEPTP